MRKIFLRKFAQEMLQVFENERLKNLKYVMRAALTRLFDSHSLYPRPQHLVSCNAAAGCGGFGGGSSGTAVV
jgi:hypothetical protein